MTKKKKLKLSLDSKVAKDLNLKIGDSIRFNIYGNSVSGVITNFRKVNYKDLNINFEDMVYSVVLYHPQIDSIIIGGSETSQIKKNLKLQSQFNKKFISKFWKESVKWQAPYI